MEKWFIINISSLEIPEGFFEFYFGTLSDDVYYYNERKGNKVSFERLLHDKLAAELLKNYRPNYNLLFVVSNPVNVLESIDKAERGSTPFIHYLHQEIEKLGEFIGISASNTLVVEADENFEAFSVYKKSTQEYLNNIYNLDHLKKSTDYYQVGKTWDKDLLKTLENNHNQSNLDYLLTTAPLFYFRIPLKDKNRIESLHQVFSFFQLVIDGNIDLNDTTIRKGRFQELSFTSNDIREKIPGLVDQISNSLNATKSSIEKKELKAILYEVEENKTNIEDQLSELSEYFDAWKINETALTCRDMPNHFEEWQTGFDKFLSGAEIKSEQFLNYLNNKSNVVKERSEEHIGAKQFFEERKMEFENNRASENRHRKTTLVDYKESLEDLRSEVYGHFNKIKKDLHRCPSQIFLKGILIVSLLFYLIACSTLLSDFYKQIPFILMTIVYIVASVLLYNHYNKKSIKKIRSHLRKIKLAINKSGVKLEEALAAKKTAQLSVYKLNTINRNLQVLESVFEDYISMEQKITLLQNNSSDIRTIGVENGKPENYRFAEQITYTPTSLSDYLEVFNRMRKDQTVTVEKDKSPQEPIVLMDLKINAIDKIMINTVKQ